MDDIEIGMNDEKKIGMNIDEDTEQITSGCGICLVILFAFVLLWISAIAVGHSYYRSPCAAQSYLPGTGLNLSVWFLVDIYAILGVSIFFVIVYAFRKWLDNWFRNWLNASDDGYFCCVCKWIPMLVIILIVIAFWLLMFMIGFIILLSMTRSCISEVLPLFIFTIILLIFHFLGLLIVMLARK